MVVVGLRVGDGGRVGVDVDGIVCASASNCDSLYLAYPLYTPHPNPRSTRPPRLSSDRGGLTCARLPLARTSSRPDTFPLGL